MKNLRILKASSIVARLEMHFSELMVSRFFSYHPGVRVLRALLVGVASNGNPSETAENLLPCAAGNQCRKPFPCIMHNGFCHSKVSVATSTEKAGMPNSSYFTTIIFVTTLSSALGVAARTR